MEGPKRPVVLVVDDEPLNASVFVRSFRRELDVRIADSGAGALAALEAGGVEVLITDYRMPVMDGLSLLAEVARRWPALPRILLSGQDTDELKQAVQSGLALGLILKPWEKAEVLALVHRALAGGGGVT